MTYDDIVRASAVLKTENIKGKDYVCVNERIKAFRILFPEGTITTDILFLEDGVVTMKASVYDENMKLLASGLAQEKETSSYINKTSFIENCETSAVGRALGMLGIGVDTSVCSSDELKNALNNQGAETKCADCGETITNSTKRSGELWTASDIAAYTQKKFGRPLCTACASKEGK